MTGTMATNGIHQHIARSNGRVNGTTLVEATEYVSPSRLKLWLRCPQAYKNRYVDGIVTRTTPSLFLGARVHEALELYHRFRERSITVFPEYIGEHIGKTWPRAVEDECIMFESEDEERQLQSQAVNLVTTYLGQVREDEPPPMAVEKRFEAPLIDPVTGEDLGISLVGIVDLVLDDGQGAAVIDFKTAARSSSQVDVMHEIQMSCYSYLFRQVTGQTETALEIRSLIKTKTPKVELHRFGPRQDIHFKRLFDVIRAYLDAVGSNRFHIRPGIECSFCDFKETCAGTAGI